MFSLPFVSVITPTAHCRASIQRAVDAVRRQDYPHVEHVIVGDACIGEARTRLAALARAAPHRTALRVVNAPSAPPGIATYRPARAANARMIGARAARGRLLAFLDDDNEFEPDHITAMVRAYEEPDVQAVYCWRQLVNPDGSPYLEPASPWYADPELARRDYERRVAAGVWEPGTNLLRDSLQSNTVDSSCWLLERDLLAKVPFRLTYEDRDRAAKLGEDVAFCFDLKRHAIPVACVQRHSVRYYLGGFSTTGDRNYTLST